MNTFASSRRRVAIAAAAVTLASSAAAMLLPGAPALAQVTYDTAPRLAFSYTDVRANTTNFPVGSTNVPVGAWLDNEGVKHKSRVYATFDLSGYAGTHLVSAALRLRDDKTTDCAVRNLAVWQTEVPAQPPTWQHPPLRLTQLGSFGATACPSVASLDLSGPVASAVAAGQQRLSVEIAVPSEAQPGEGDPAAGRSLSWYYGLQLSVGYNNPPVVEVEHLYNAARPCDTTAPYTRVNMDPLQLGAAFNDIDPMTSSMTAEYVIWPADHPEQRTTITRANVSPHWFSPVNVPAGVLADEGTFSWQARVSDGTDTSAWSQTCSFVYDNTAPANAPVVTSTNYPADGDGSSAGAAPVFTFSPNGATDVVAYQYSFGVLGAVSGYSIGNYGIPQWTDPFDGPQFVRADQPDGSATVTLPFPSAGPLTLTVRSVDAASNISPMTQYEFWVGWTPPSVSASGGTAPGEPLTLTFAPYETVTGVVSYDYWLDDEQEARTVAAGPDGIASTEVTFSGYGWHWARVISRSANGFVSSDGEWYYELDNRPSVTSDDYPADATSGGIGVPGEFTFHPGPFGAVSYVYSLNWNEEFTVAAQADGTATVSASPTYGGFQTLIVRAVDAQGQTSGEFYYYFDVPFASVTVTSDDYPQWVASGGVGVQGTFNLQGPDGTAGFVYSMDSGPATSVSAGPDGRGTFTFTPNRTGYYYLRVNAVNAAGVRITDENGPLYVFVVAQ